jgi:hypothetical protein
MTPIFGIMASSISGSKISTSSFESIATTTVGSGGSSSVTFSSIPSTYTHLQIRGIAKTGRATYGRDDIGMQFNSDTNTNYNDHLLYGNGASALATANNGSTFMDLGYIAGNGGASFFGAFVIDVLDYANTNKYKTVRNLSGVDHNGLIATFSGIVNLGSGLWRSASAVNSITLVNYTGTNFQQYSSFALYGIKGA